jgi:Helix-turn-helix domain
MWDIIEASQFLRQSIWWTYRQARLRKIPAFRVGKAWRFDPKDLQAYIDGLKDQPAA